MPIIPGLGNMAKPTQPEPKEIGSGSGMVFFGIALFVVGFLLLAGPAFRG